MSSDGEIIHLHVGQAGIQIANACWELYCLEHGINAHGCMFDTPIDDSYTTFFACSSSAKVVPRLVMVDSEPTVIDEIRTGTYAHLFKPETLINGKEDSGSNFARGYYTLGSELIEITMNSIRCVVEACSNLKGFLAFKSAGGGTGSGLGDRILEQVLDEYGKTTKIDFQIFPSPSVSPLIVEPYNSVLSTHFGMETTDCTFILDNEALYDICENKLDVPNPTYTNLNRIIGQAISAMTASLRFFGSTNVSFTEFQTNLVPFPRIHYPLVSYAPLVTMYSSCYTELTTEQLTFECFQPGSQFIRCAPTEGKYMACVLLYRGNAAPADINFSVNVMKEKGSMEFVDWSPTGFKIGINSMPPCPVPGGDVGATDRAVLALSNNTIIHRAWCRLLTKFGDLYDRRAFIHHFVSEGLEESMFMEASDDLCALIQDYYEVEGGDKGDKDFGPATLGGPAPGRSRGPPGNDNMADSGSKQKTAPRDDLPQSPRIMQKFETTERNAGGSDRERIREKGSSRRVYDSEPSKRASEAELSKSYRDNKAFKPEHDYEAVRLAQGRDLTKRPNDMAHVPPKLTREPESPKEAHESVSSKLSRESVPPKRTRERKSSSKLARESESSKQIQESVSSKHSRESVPSKRARESEASKSSKEIEPSANNQVSTNKKKGPVATIVRCCCECLIQDKNQQTQGSNSDQSRFSGKSNDAGTVRVFKDCNGAIDCQDKIDPQVLHKSGGDIEIQDGESKVPDNNQESITCLRTGKVLTEVSAVNRFLNLIEEKCLSTRKGQLSGIPKTITTTQSQKNISDAEGTLRAARFRQKDKTLKKRSQSSRKHRSYSHKYARMSEKYHNEGGDAFYCLDGTNQSSKNKTSDDHHTLLTPPRPSIPHHSKTITNIPDICCDRYELAPRSVGSYAIAFEGDRSDETGLVRRSENSDKGINDADNSAKHSQSQLPHRLQMDLNIGDTHSDGTRLVPKSNEDTNDADYAAKHSRLPIPHRLPTDLNFEDTNSDDTRLISKSKCFEKKANEGKDASTLHSSGREHTIQSKNSDRDRVISMPRANENERVLKPRFSNTELNTRGRSSDRDRPTSKSTGFTKFDLDAVRCSEEHSRSLMPYPLRKLHSIGNTYSDDKWVGPRQKISSKDANDENGALSKPSAIPHCSLNEYNTKNIQSDDARVVPNTEASNKNCNGALSKPLPPTIPHCPEIEPSNRDINYDRDGPTSRSKRSYKITFDGDHSDEMGLYSSNKNIKVKDEELIAMAQTTILRQSQTEPDIGATHFDGTKLALESKSSEKKSDDGHRPSGKASKMLTPYRSQRELNVSEGKSNREGRTPGSKSNLKITFDDNPVLVQSLHPLAPHSSRSLLSIGETFSSDRDASDGNHSPSKYSSSAKLNIGDAESNGRGVVPRPDPLNKRTSSGDHTSSKSSLSEARHRSQTKFYIGDTHSDKADLALGLDSSNNSTAVGDRGPLKSSKSSSRIQCLTELGGINSAGDGLNPKSESYHKSAPNIFKLATPLHSQKELNFKDKNFNGTALVSKSENSDINANDGNDVSTKSPQPTIICFRVEVNLDQNNLNGDELVLSLDKSHKNANIGDHTAPLQITEIEHSSPGTNSGGSELVPKLENSNEVNNNRDIESSIASIPNHSKLQPDIGYTVSNRDELNPGSERSYNMAEDENRDSSKRLKALTPHRSHLVINIPNMVSEEVGLPPESESLHKIAIDDGRCSVEVSDSLAHSKTHTDQNIHVTHFDRAGLLDNSTTSNRNANNEDHGMSKPPRSTITHCSRTNLSTERTEFNEHVTDSTLVRSHNITYDRDHTPLNALKPMIPSQSQIEPRVRDTNKNGDPRSVSFLKIANNGDCSLAIPLLSSTSNNVHAEHKIGDLYSNRGGIIPRSESSQRISNNRDCALLNSSRLSKPFQTETELEIKDTIPDTDGPTPGYKCYRIIGHDKDNASTKSMEWSIHHRSQPEPNFENRKSDKARLTPRREYSPRIANDSDSVFPKSQPSQTKLYHTYSNRSAINSAPEGSHMNTSSKRSQSSGLNLSRTEVNIWNTYHNRPQQLQTKFDPNHSDRIASTPEGSHTNVSGHALTKPSRSSELHLARTEVNIWNTYHDEMQQWQTKLNPTHSDRYASVPKASHMNASDHESLKPSRSSELHLSRTEVNIWNTHRCGTELVIRPKKSPDLVNNADLISLKSSQSILHHSWKQLSARGNNSDRSVLTSKSERLKKIAYYNDHASVKSSRSSIPHRVWKNFSIRGSHFERSTVASESEFSHNIAYERNDCSSKCSRCSLLHRSSKDLGEHLRLSARSKRIHNRMSAGSSVTSGSRLNIRDHCSNRSGPSQRTYDSRSNISRSSKLSRSVKQHYFGIVMARGRISDMALIREHIALRRKYNMMTKIPTRTQIYQSVYPDSYQQGNYDDDDMDNGQEAVSQMSVN